MLARMKTDVHLVGTGLKLQRGQLVEVWEASNLPQGGYFARPADGSWSDRIIHDGEDSIHVTENDITIERQCESCKTQNNST